MKLKDLKIGQSTAMKLPAHPKDVLISITIEDVITTVQSNIPSQSRNAEAVHKTWKEMLKLAVADAEHDLNENMKMILKESESK